MRDGYRRGAAPVQVRELLDSPAAALALEHQPAIGVDQSDHAGLPASERYAVVLHPVTPPKSWLLHPASEILRGYMLTHTAILHRPYAVGPIAVPPLCGARDINAQLPHWKVVAASLRDCWPAERHPRSCGESMLVLLSGS